MLSSLLAIAREWWCARNSINLPAACVGRYATNYEIRHIETGPSFLIHHVDHGFMCYYALELLSKLAVHRQFFFCNGAVSHVCFCTAVVHFASPHLRCIESLSRGCRCSERHRRFRHGQIRSSCAPSGEPRQLDMDANNAMRRMIVGPSEAPGG